MFDSLQDRFEGIVRSLRGQARISESNIEEAVADIRRALLEADVHVKVVRDFIATISEKALGAEVLKSVSPGQQFTKLLNDELTELLGGHAEPIRWVRGGPTVIMMVGLQGSGKTTSAGKLAALLKKKGRKPFLIAADIYRPAAVEQLVVLGKQIGVPVFTPVDQDPLRTAVEGLAEATRRGADTVLLDTAGRLHIAEDMMQELERIRETLQPAEILFVADAMIGQDAVNAAGEFNRRLEFTGVILTKLDGDTRGGAAMSIRSVTGKPVKFVGVGEKLDALEQFHPDRMAQRILGMGDVVTLVEKAQEQIDRVDAEKMAGKLARAEFDLEDFLSQMQVIKRMGPLEGLLKMIPGIGSKISQLNMDPKSLVRTESIIHSMTKAERKQPTLINGSRKRRIARGAGRSENEVQALLTQFTQMKGVLKQMASFGGLGSLMGGGGAGAEPGAAPGRMPMLPGMPGMRQFSTKPGRAKSKKKKR
ncbi:MAG: signal recognition particle protein [Candidatus Delongbacteria bacterium]|nr:signal recognition particle protein [Candidatus Delongbacteria bacterium]